MVVEASLCQSIVLVGMMGCGKSAIGKRLSKALGLPFYDLDKYIEKHEGKTVSEIFEDQGEDYFRKKEYEYIKEILEDKPKVIALGGGAFIQENVQKIVKQKAISIWIYAPFEILLERVSRKNTRPLLEQGDKATILKQLMEVRYPIYEESDMKVNTTTGPHHVVIESIISTLKDRGYLQ